MSCCSVRHLVAAIKLAFVQQQLSITLPVNPRSRERWLVFLSMPWQFARTARARNITAGERILRDNSMALALGWHSGTATARCKNLTLEFYPPIKRLYSCYGMAHSRLVRTLRHGRAIILIRWKGHTVDLETDALVLESLTISRLVEIFWSQLTRNMGM